MGLDPYPGFSFGTYVLRPESCGSVHIRKPEAAEHPEIRANYLSHEYDVRTMLAALRMIRKIAAQPSLAKHIVRETRPGPEAASDDALLDHVRKTGQTSYHPIGTCRMGSDARAVVDARLRVHGVEGLRVCDPPSCRPGGVEHHAPSILWREGLGDLVWRMPGIDGNVRELASVFQLAPYLSNGPRDRLKCRTEMTPRMSRGVGTALALLWCLA